VVRFKNKNSNFKKSIRRKKMARKDNLRCPECGENLKPEWEKVYPFRCLTCGAWLFYVRVKGKIEIKILPTFKK